MSFTVLTPGQSENVSPAATAPTNPTFQWRAVTGGSTADGAQYRLWVEHVASGTKVLDVTRTASGSSCGSGPPATCSYQPSPADYLAALVPDETYTWYVLTWNTTNFIGCWSAPTQFTTVGGATLVAATLIAPSGPASNFVPFSWNAVNGATHYRLWVNDADTTREVDITYTAAEAGCASGAGECSVTITEELTPGTATWWIQTSNATTTGPWSTGMRFSVGNVGTPVLVSPSGPQATNTPTYAWNAASGATTYRLWVNDSAASPKINLTYSASAICAGGTCSVTPPTAIASGSAKWWVQANAGAWSTPLSFTVP
jgi:hypothetical protein